MTTYVLHIPPGLSMKHFEAKKQELEQAFGGTIEFGGNGGQIIMTVYENVLKNKYDFVFEETNSPLKVYCAESNKGKLYLDIAKMPHCLLAGETGGGKTSLLDVITISLIQNKYDLDLHLIDFQDVGLGKYEDCKKVKSFGNTPAHFGKLLDELEDENRRRLAMFRSVKKRMYIDSLAMWNKRFPEKALPFKVIIVDEAAKLAEKAYQDFLEALRTRVSMDRKVGLHFLVSIQRPSVDMLQGSLKANLPCRIAFQAACQVDSRVILDREGAEQLKTPGRFIIKYAAEYTEAQALYIDSEYVFDYLKKNKLFKTEEERQLERREKIRKWQEKNPNPYAKKVEHDNKA